MFLIENQLRFSRTAVILHFLTLGKVLAANSSNKNANNVKAFWEKVPLVEMSDSQWESLCDGCGKCCLNKLEDWDTGEIFFTNIACTLFDDKTCQCKNYQNRFDTVPDCVKLQPGQIDKLPWLPKTCAYRLVHEGSPLPDWHYLICGDRDAVHKANVSVRGKTISEDGKTPEDYEDHVIDWIE